LSHSAIDAGSFVAVLAVVALADAVVDAPPCAAAVVAVVSLLLLSLSSLPHEAIVMATATPAAAQTAARRFALMPSPLLQPETGATPIS
jgi:hypothetical protein